MTTRYGRGTDHLTAFLALVHCRETRAFSDTGATVIADPPGADTPLWSTSDGGTYQGMLATQGPYRMGTPPLAIRTSLPHGAAAEPRAVKAFRFDYYPLGGTWKVTSTFNKAREMRGGYYHLGIDVSARPDGKVPIFAASAGKVVYAGWGIKGTGCNGYGNVVVIDHHNGFHSLYGHMHALPCVDFGEEVKAGQHLGFGGDTGVSFGAHLHFSVFDDNYPVNPVPYLEGAKHLESTGQIVGRAIAIKRSMAFLMGEHDGLQFDKLHAAAIVGNLLLESGLDPGAVNPTSGAYGIAQWLGGRVTRFGDYKHGAALKGSSLEDQLGYILYELQNSEKAAFKAFVATKTLTEAVKAWEHSYERAKGAGMDQRLAFAQEVYRR